MNTAIQFVRESYYELRKSSWLTRKEVIASTWAVIILTALLAMFIAGIDFVLSVLMGSILGR
jgi:preprotein translocase subunit SecE